MTVPAACVAAVVPPYPRVAIVQVTVPPVIDIAESRICSCSIVMMALYPAGIFHDCVPRTDDEDPVNVPDVSDERSCASSRNDALSRR